MANERHNQTNTAGGSKISGGEFDADTMYFGSVSYQSEPPLTNNERASLLAQYRAWLRDEYGKIGLFYDRNSGDLVTVDTDAAYMELQAAPRQQAPAARRKHNERRDALAKELKERLNEHEIAERLYDFDFFFNVGLDLKQGQPTDLHAVISQHPRLAILGEPGGGKTTILRYLALMITVEQSRPSYLGDYVPLLVRLTDLGHYTPQALIEQAVPATITMDEQTRLRLIKLLTEYATSGKVIFLLDGLDEVDSARRSQLAGFLASLAKHHCQPNRNRVVVTCRVANYDSAPLDGGSDGYQHYAVLRLQPKQQRSFLGHWFGAWAQKQGQSAEWASQRADALTAELSKPGLQRLAQVPLLLSMLAWLWQGQQQLPDTRAGIYKRVVSLLLSWTGRQQRGPTIEPAKVYKAVAPLAYALLAKRLRGLFSRDDALRFMDAELWDRLYHHPISKVANGEGGKEGGLFMLRGRRQLSPADEFDPGTVEDLYGFPHLTFAEYFAGCYLVSGTLEEAKERILRHLHDDRWQEAILLGLGYLQEISPKSQLGAASPAGQIVYDLCLNPQRKPSDYDDVLYRDLLFALRAAGGGITLREGDEQEVCKQGVKLYFDFPIFITVPLETTQGSKITLRLATDLLTVLRDQTVDSDVRNRAASALGKLGQGSEMVLTGLLTVLRDQTVDSRVRNSAASALGELGQGSEMVLTSLLTVLRDQTVTSYVRNSAACALGKLGQGSEMVLTGLLMVLRDQTVDIRVRKDAAYALGRLGQGSDEVTAYWLTVLRDQTVAIYVRERAAYALVAVLQKNPSHLPAVLPALYAAAKTDANYLVHRTLAQLADLAARQQSTTNPDPVAAKLPLPEEDA